jgi:hypothetical protein
MKFSILCVCLSVVLTAGELSAEAIRKVARPSNCAMERSGVLICQRIAPAGRYSGQEGTYKDNVMGKTCSWKCKVNGGLEVCKAEGPECNGKYPPHWR